MNYANGRRAAPLLAAVGLTFGLSGCIAVIPALMVAGVAAGGFIVYKTVQVAGGGSVDVEFPGLNGKTAPAQALPAFRRAAVWPGDQAEVKFAGRLQSSGKFAAVLAPAAVSPMLSAGKIAANLQPLTDPAKGEALESLCKRGGIDFIFAAVSAGSKENSNMLSFSAANTTYTYDLLGYSCSQHQIAWRDQLALVVSKNVTAATAMSEAGADAWADRVLGAMPK